MGTFFGWLLTQKSQTFVSEAIYPFVDKSFIYANSLLIIHIMDNILGDAARVV